MARDTDPESRPISVAEILARRAAAEDGATEPRSGGRRRRGGEGTVSVAELTGEIPRIRGGAHSGSFRAVDADDLARDDDATTGGLDLDGTPDVVSGSDLAEVAPTTGELAAASALVPDEPHVTDDGWTATFPPSDSPTPPAPDDRSPQPVWARAQAWSASVGPPATRDLNSGDVRDRLADRPDEQTGVIPRIAADPRAADPRAADDRGADDLAGLTPEQRDRAFESYRNFDDVDVPEEPQRRGLFSWLRRSRRTETPSVARTDLLATTDPQPTEQTTGLQTGRPGTVPDDTPTVLTDVSRETWGAPAWPDAPGTTDTGSSETDTSAETVPVETAHQESDQQGSADEESAAPEAGAADDEQTAGTTRFAAVPADDDTGVVDLDAIRRADTVRPAWRADRTPSEQTDPSPPETAPTDTAPTETGPSPARQWAMLALQVIGGLLAGVGLFVGFTELWRWNVWFALVLAVVVIFGLVTLVHVVRRSSDLLSTFLALAVGLVVTIGPLAFLATGN